MLRGQFAFVWADSEMIAECVRRFVDAPAQVIGAQLDRRAILPAERDARLDSERAQLAVFDLLRGFAGLVK
jgi:hypothetical protein